MEMDIEIFGRKVRVKVRSSKKPPNRYIAFEQTMITENSVRNDNVILYSSPMENHLLIHEPTITSGDIGYWISDYVQLLTGGKFPDVIVRYMKKCEKPFYVWDINQSPITSWQPNSRKVSPFIVAADIIKEGKKETHVFFVFAFHSFDGAEIIDKIIPLM